MTQQIAGTELRFTQGFAAAERQVLTDEAVEFLAELVAKFTPRRNELLAARVRWQQNIDRGELPGFISETNSIRGATGRSAAFRKTCAIAGLRSPGRSSAKW